MSWEARRLDDLTTLEGNADSGCGATRNYDSDKDLTLTGMKVKMRDSADGLWMWVIVGADRKVVVFERDINWITFPGHRGTEK